MDVKLIIKIATTTISAAGTIIKAIADNKK